MMSDPWGSISNSDHPRVDNVRVVDPNHPLVFRRGKDFQGRYLFFLEGAGWAVTAKDLPRLSGIDVNVVNGSPGRLVLTLLEPEQKDIFQSLCVNLVEATKSLNKGDSKQGVNIVLNRIKRWQELLKKRSAGALSKSEVMGLVGELLFLKDLLLPSMSIADAVNAWTGPLGNEQDYSLGCCAVEVKTQLVSSDRRLRISSEHQLDGRSAPILLWHLLLGVAPDAEPARVTLNELVSLIQEKVFAGPVGAADAFNTALMEVGYWPRPEYDDYCWQVVGTQFFEVRTGFPAITPNCLDPGVHSVSYSIDMESCLDFVVSDEQAKEVLFSEAD